MKVWRLTIKSFAGVSFLTLINAIEKNYALKGDSA